MEKKENQNTSENIIPIFIREKDLKRFYGISPSTARRLMKKGCFPLRRRLGCCVGWLSEELTGFFANLPEVVNG
jgi:predicted DNA-binding transcriptional regulator AlpA